jgi:hypothetical protein
VDDVLLAVFSVEFRSAACALVWVLNWAPAADVPPPDVAARATPPPARKPARVMPAPQRNNHLWRDRAEENREGEPAGVLS